MLDSQVLIEAMYNYGRQKALELRAAAPELTDTEVIEQELFIPTWHEGQQILDAVVKYEGQVYRVLQAHDSTGNPSWNPASSSALFGVCHTKNPLKAKPWVAPMGTSGLYYLDECYVDIDGIIWKQIFDGGNVYDAATVPERWEVVNLYGEDTPEGEEETEIIVDNNENNEPDNPPIDEPGGNTGGNENNQGGENGGSGENGDEPIIDNPSDEWKQPTGAHDAYDVGAIVSHNGKIWINTSPANIYEPGVFGWNEVVE